MKTIVLDTKDYTTTTWSGGETTQLYIYPKDASYAQRDFLFRLSSATVVDKHSVFTHLPSVKRYICPLSSTFSLTHLDNDKIKSKVTLNPYDVHFFDGGILTECDGNGKDFNLMLKNVNGQLTLCDFLNGTFDFVFVYCTQKITATITQNDNANFKQVLNLNPNQLLTIIDAKNLNLTLSRPSLTTTITL